MDNITCNLTIPYLHVVPTICVLCTRRKYIWYILTFLLIVVYLQKVLVQSYNLCMMGLTPSMISFWRRIFWLMWTKALQKSISRIFAQLWSSFALLIRCIISSSSKVVDLHFTSSNWVGSSLFELTFDASNFTHTQWKLMLGLLP